MLALVIVGLVFLVPIFYNLRCCVALFLFAWRAEMYPVNAGWHIDDAVATQRKSGFYVTACFIFVTAQGCMIAL